ncbi:hypothetical protein BJY21_001438 [Kineosphaera limosa]|uniref:VCBS repeat-containing protein n=1 Tax=Kineosphaera limosa NBRC 100340 TaxID=1184609 RepID=K6X0X9_9MICO|nr:hypothetical protein [Kineosphaera limosa]NYE00254.1 hypothetical protein [Kineosphaera limosa]GAB98032.1 hypothetical protein KILIM_095_00100 [Kineosphaera limosa NBRC 100340]
MSAVRARRTAASAIVAAAIAGSAIGGAATAQAAAPSPVSSVTAVAAGVGTAPTRTYRADVDGDGRADQVTVASTRNHQLRVTVRTATKRTASILIDQSDFGTAVPDTPYYGAADFDGVRGQELFIFYGFGAHTPWFKMLTWRDGRLFATRDPYSGEPSWAPDAAYGYGTGYTLSGKGANKKLVVTQATHVLNGDGYRGTDTTYAWSTAKNRWLKKSTRAVRFSDERSMRHFGWHAPGLKAMPWM